MTSYLKPIYIPGNVAASAAVSFEGAVPDAQADPNGLEQHAPGAKLDSGKALVWLCIGGFARAIRTVAEVTTIGARKYTPNGWMAVSDGPNRYMEAFGRHALALGSGEVIDPETGCRHKAQMIWNLLASLELELREEEKK